NATIGCTSRSCCSPARSSANAASCQADGSGVEAKIGGRAPPILIRDDAPAPGRDRLARQRARAPLPPWVGLLSQHAAPMLPAITEVKDKPELGARTDGPSDLHGRVILDDIIVVERLGVDEPEPPPVGELELVQVRQIPTRERRVD